MGEEVGDTLLRPIEGRWSVKWTQHCLINQDFCLSYRLGLNIMHSHLPSFSFSIYFTLSHASGALTPSVQGCPRCSNIHLWPLGNILSQEQICSRQCTLLKGSVPFSWTWIWHFHQFSIGVGGRGQDKGWQKLFVQQILHGFSKVVQIINLLFVVFTVFQPVHSTAFFRCSLDIKCHVIFFFSFSSWVMGLILACSLMTCWHEALNLELFLFAFFVLSTIYKLSWMSLWFIASVRKSKTKRYLISHSRVLN